MPVECYFTDRRTNLMYGPYCLQSLADLDTLMRSDLGFPPDPEHWLSGWAFEGSIAGAVAWNTSPEDIDQRVSEQINPELKAVWAYLREHFVATNNWGPTSKWKQPKVRIRKVTA